MAFSDKIMNLGSAVGKRVKATAPGAGQRKEAAGTLEKGRKFYNQKNYAKAEDLFSRAVSADRSYALAHYYLGLARYKLDNQRGAERCWKDAMAAEPGSEAAYKAEKKINHVKKKLQGAINELQGGR